MRMLEYRLPGILHDLTPTYMPKFSTTFFRPTTDNFMIKITSKNKLMDTWIDSESSR